MFIEYEIIKFLNKFYNIFYIFYNNLFTNRIKDYEQVKAFDIRE